jgi:probable rRNA maturation factor
MRPLPGAVSRMADPGPSPTGASGSQTLAVEVMRVCELWDPSPVSDDALIHAARAAYAAASPLGAEACQVTLVLADDAELQRLNREWRGIDTPTNVLSFPTGFDAGEPSAAETGEPSPLGDLVLAFETAAKEAAESGIALSDHVVHLTVHGVLHLLGFDHEDEDEVEEMEALERKILASLGIADPYAEANGRAVAEVSP